MSEKDNLKQLIKLLQQDKEIILVIVFGSYAKDSISANSDIDIAIKARTPLLESKKLELIKLIAQVCGRPVDLVDLHKIGEPLLGQIIKHGKLLIGNQSDFTELAIKHLYSNEDFVPYVQRTLKERRERWIK